MLAGAFLAQRAQGVPVEFALEMAVKTASVSVTQFGVDHLRPRDFTQKKPEMITAILVINDEGEVFLGKSPKFDGKWIAPGGHLEEGESFVNCAIREIKEELGVDVHSLKFLRTHLFIAPEYKNKGAKFICWNFVGRFNGKSSNMVISPAEYSDYCFINPKKALKMPDIHPTAKSIILYYLNDKECTPLDKTINK
ncbi:MAG: hypothetical protein ACD_46C00286G0003 [uncultured bacterium]|nr:MAG: hypothetical protein ACD_46C00286G0003 [uncultured bacterium]